MESIAFARPTGARWRARRIEACATACGGDRPLWFSGEPIQISQIQRHFAGSRSVARTVYWRAMCSLLDATEDAVNAPSNRPAGVIAIKHLDTAALHVLRTAAVSASPPASRSAPPPVLDVPHSPRARSNGRRFAFATFALGLLLGAFSSRLGETGPADVATRATVASEPTIRSEAPPLPSPENRPASDPPKTTTPSAERAPAAEPSSTVRPAHHHHRTPGSTAQITVEESPKPATSPALATPH
jgi:hypothetical protein